MHILNLSWLMNEDGYSLENGLTTIDTPKGREQLVNAILLAIEAGCDIHIWDDGCSLVLEAKDKEEGSFEWRDFE